MPVRRNVDAGPRPAPGRQGWACRKSLSSAPGIGPWQRLPSSIGERPVVTAVLAAVITAFEARPKQALIRSARRCAPPFSSLP